jgi:hypothetical protein
MMRVARLPDRAQTMLVPLIKVLDPTTPLVSALLSCQIVNQYISDTNVLYELRKPSKSELRTRGKQQCYSKRNNPCPWNL